MRRPKWRLHLEQLADRFRAFSFDELDGQDIEQRFPTPKSCLGWQYTARLVKRSRFIEIHVVAAFADADTVSRYTHEFKRYRDGRLVEEKPGPPED